VIEESRISDKIQAISQASQAAMKSCHRPIDNLEGILQLILSKVEGIDTVDSQVDNIIGLLGGRPELIPPQHPPAPPVAQHQQQNRQQPQQQQVQQEQEDSEEADDNDDDDDFPANDDDERR
jgi:hypothetical protein